MSSDGLVSEIGSRSEVPVESFKERLISDLERYFFYNGQSGRTPQTRDLWRNFVVPRCAPVGLYRVAHQLHLIGFRRLAKLLTWLNFYLYGVEISARCDVGSHFYMPHASGTVIGAASIGRYAVIYHQVTLGAKSIEFGDNGRPVIGDFVLIGAGAKILGDIVVGDGCRIGANSLVMESVPPKSLVVSSTAKIIVKSE